MVVDLDDEGPGDCIRRGVRTRGGQRARAPPRRPTVLADARLLRRSYGLRHLAGHHRAEPPRMPPTALQMGSQGEQVWVELEHGVGNSRYRHHPEQSLPRPVSRWLADRVGFARPRDIRSPTCAHPCPLVPASSGQHRPTSATRAPGAFTPRAATPRRPAHRGPGGGQGLLVAEPRRDGRARLRFARWRGPGAQWAVLGYPLSRHTPPTQAAVRAGSAGRRARWRRPGGRAEVRTEQLPVKEPLYGPAGRPWVGAVPEGRSEGRLRPRCGRRRTEPAARSGVGGRKSEVVGRVRRRAGTAAAGHAG